jgi:hypothetical protein
VVERSGKLRTPLPDPPIATFTGDLFYFYFFILHCLVCVCVAGRIAGAVLSAYAGYADVCGRMLTYADVCLQDELQGQYSAHLRLVHRLRGCLRGMPFRTLLEMRHES